MAKVLMPLAQGFEEIEAVTVVDILRRAEIDVVIAGLQPGPIEGAHNISIIPDTTIDAVNSDSFDMIVLPGGQPGTDNLNADSRIHALLDEFAAREKLIGAICAAPIVLAASGLLHGKTVTCYPSYKNNLEGAVYEDKSVITTGNLITSKGPGTAVIFGLEIVAQLAGKHVADRVSRDLLFIDSRHQVESSEKA